MKMLGFCLRVIFVFLILSISLSTPAAHGQTTAQAYIDKGEKALFSDTATGVFQAHAVFQEALTKYPADPLTPVIHAYLAVTRLLDLILREDQTGLTGFLEKYGVERTASAPSAIEFRPSKTDDGYLVLPTMSSTEASAELIRSFAAGPVLAAVNASVSNLDAAISGWNNASKYIISKTKLGSDHDLELDFGDLYLLRAILKMVKSLILTATAYDANVDVREIVALINVDQFKAQDFLNRYSHFLTLLTVAASPFVNGAAQLAQAKAVLVEGITDYESASDRIRNDPGTAPGAEELIQLGPDDAAQEQLFRENLAKLKSSLNGSGSATADLILKRVGTEYSVYGGASFSTTEPYYWNKGYHPEYFGYTYLGTANSAVATFTGSYAYYIITTDRGNVAPVDAVRGSNGSYYPTYANGNTINPSNVAGSPNGAYALVGGQYSGDSGGFIVIGPTTGVSSITVTIVPAGVAQYEEHLSLNLSEFFNKTPNVRDFLPQFDCRGEPIYGTMGSGLGNDPTLGGILPAYTQDKWGLEASPSGNIIIPTVPNDSINVQDHSITDWGAISPVFNDRTGDGYPSLQGSDLSKLYLAKDANYLYVRMTLADGVPNTSPSYPPDYARMQYFVQFRLNDERYTDARMTSASYINNAWQVLVTENRSVGGFVVHYNSSSGDAQAVVNDLEWRVRLSDIGPIGGRLLSTWTHYTPGSASPGDYNDTCLRVGTGSTISGTLTVPSYNGSGLIFLVVYRAENGVLKPSSENLLAGDIIYPGEYTPGMTYQISGIPVGEQVFVAARWDADYTGVSTGGDYLAKFGPLTATSGGATANLSPSTPYAKGDEAPYFVSSNVMAFNTPGSMGMSTSVDATVVDPNGRSPYTLSSLTVSGPNGFNYVFTDADFINPNYAWRQLPGLPADGFYTFVATDEEGNTATSTCYLKVGTTIPLPDETTLQASGNPLTPTLSWGAVKDYQGNLWYRARIFDSAGNIFWTSSLATGTAVTVPSGVLTSGESYKWRVEAFDNYTYNVSSNRAASKTVSLEIDAGTPYFSMATVYREREQGKNDRTRILVRVDDPNGTLPASIKAIEVRDPNNALLYSTDPGQFTYASSNKQFTAVLEGAPPPAGMYRFVITDIEDKTKITYDYMAPSTIPMVNSTSLLASSSGNLLTPWLSWEAPDVMDRSLYYQVIIDNKQNGSRVWSSSRVVGTSIQVPQGTLSSGGSYRWYVRTSDNINMVHFSNESWSGTVDLVLGSVDGGRPYFETAAVYKINDSTGIYTALETSVFDPNGTLPGSIQSLRVTGPGLDKDILQENYSYIPSIRDFFLMVPGAPQAGVYTFTITDADGARTTRDYLRDGVDMPIVDHTSITVSGNPLAPTVSWKAISGYEGKPYYRVRVYDSSGTPVYASNRDPVTAMTIPQGYTQSGQSYNFRIEVQDDTNFVVYNTRSNSQVATWQAPQVETVSISGTVRDLDGHPISGLRVWACSSKGWYVPSIATATTDEDGSYVLSLPSDQYGKDVYLRTCAGCTHMNYGDRFFDWGEGATDYTLAAPVPVAANQSLTDMDFYLQEGPKRLQYFQVQVVTGNAVGADGLVAQFGVQPGFRDQLVRAALTMPNANRVSPYEFKLLAEDKNHLVTGDTECRYIDGGWEHAFGSAEAADYGKYTLTLEFGDGSQETYEWTLRQVTVVPVGRDSIDVTVFDDGSALVSWDPPTPPVGQYYEVRVRDLNNKEYYRSGSPYNATSIAISANELRCLKPGQTYNWFVRASDDVYPNWSRIEFEHVAAAYSPSALVNRVRLFSLLKTGDKLQANLAVYPGTTDLVQEAKVTFPDKSFYMFKQEDWLDLSTETALYAKFWRKEFQFQANMYGDYNLQVVFSDGYTENVPRTLTQASVAPVAAITANAAVYPDGAVTFWWGLPGVSGQKYELRIQSLDGSKEYYRSSTSTDMSTLTLWPSDLRALEFGTSYQWVVRVYDANNNALEQTVGLTFLYDPANPTGISGRVTDSWGIPIPNLYVYVHADGCTGPTRGGTTTDQDGTYTLYLPAGTYIARAYPTATGQNYVDEWYGGVYNCSDATPITVPSGKVQSGIDFVLELGGTISGRVTDASGNGLANVNVSAKANNCNGQWVTGTNTDQNGNYTLRLFSGTYILRACATCAGLSYVDEYYSGAYDCTDSSPVLVYLGGVTGPINFTLEPGGQISGHVYEHDGTTPISNLHVYATDYASGKWVAGANTDANGSYTVVVPTGAYRVRACASCSNLSYVDEYYNNTIDYSAAASISVTAPGASSGKDFSLLVPGDINGNGVVDLADAMLAMQVTVGMNPAGVNRSDVNRDGKIGLAEVLYILQKVAGLR